MRLLVRRFSLFATIVLLGSAASVFYALSLERVFQAFAVVQIRSPQVSAETAGATQDVSTARRIQQIEQQLLSRDSLLEVADKYGLFVADDMSASDRVGLMRESVRLESVAGVPTGYGVPPQPSALVITVRLADAERTALVANEFVTRLLERNLRDRERRIAETLDFFRREESQLARQVAEIDGRILAYRAENASALPEGLEFRRDELARLGEDERDLSRQLIALERGRLELGDMGGLAGAPADPVRAELQRLEIALARRRAISPNHPDIPFLEDQIAILASTDSAAQLQLAERRGQLIADETALLRAQIDRIAERQAELLAQIEASPGVELGLSTLMREREQLQQQLAAAIQSRSDAEVVRRLETSRQSEQFEVLESALVPEYPEAPSRRRIALAGMAASIVLALGAVMLLDRVRPVIRTGAQFRREFGIAPTVMLPYIATPWERRRRRLSSALAILMVVAGLPASLYLLDRHVVSLEEIAEAIDRLPLPTL